jgi:hypothetical protein
VSCAFKHKLLHRNTNTGKISGNLFMVLFANLNQFFCIVFVQ